MSDCWRELFVLPERPRAANVKSNGLGRPQAVRIGRHGRIESVEAPLHVMEDLIPQPFAGGVRPGFQGDLPCLNHCFLSCCCLSVEVDVHCKCQPPMNCEGIIKADSREISEERARVVDGPSVRVKKLHMDRRNRQESGDVSQKGRDGGGWGHLDVDTAPQIRVDKQGDLEDVLTLPKRELCDASPVVIESSPQVTVRMETRG